MKYQYSSIIFFLWYLGWEKNLTSVSFCSCTEQIENSCFSSDKRDNICLITSSETVSADLIARKTSYTLCSHLNLKWKHWLYHNVRREINSKSYLLVYKFVLYRIVTIFVNKNERISDQIGYTPKHFFFFNEFFSPWKKGRKLFLLSKSTAPPPPVSIH